MAEDGQGLEAGCPVIGGGARGQGRLGPRAGFGGWVDPALGLGGENGGGWYLGE